MIQFATRSKLSWFSCAAVLSLTVALSGAGCASPDDGANDLSDNEGEELEGSSEELSARDLVGYPGAKKIPASAARHKAPRSKSGIKRIAIHALVGFYKFQVNDWQRAGGNTNGTHYIVSKQGEVTQMISDLRRAQHVPGNNNDTIGIEHEDASKSPFRTSENDPDWATDDEYEASAKLVAWLCNEYDVPVDRRHIMGHSEMRANHSDPGEYWDWDKYMRLVRKETQALSGSTRSVDAPPVASTSSCKSSTLGRVVAEQVCVQSRSDSKWYTCEAGGWIDGQVDCTEKHPL
jgi:N-acetyl-anhydromuramyl-L-alanine amidase AmpD